MNNLRWFVFYQIVFLCGCTYTQQPDMWKGSSESSSKIVFSMDDFVGGAEFYAVPEDYTCGKTAMNKIGERGRSVNKDCYSDNGVPVACQHMSIGNEIDSAFVDAKQNFRVLVNSRVLSINEWPDDKYEVINDEHRKNILTFDLLPHHIYYIVPDRESQK